MGPIQAIYQARFNRYLENRGLKKPGSGKVWAFLGDGETDEPETLGAITLASREKLDNLIFVVNCNLQRLDGPVRGNGKIIQELEAIFRGAGWNVIKVIWGGDWDPLIQSDRDGLLVKRMGEITDGQYQKYLVESGAYFRQNFFGTDPRLLKMVEHLSDEQLAKMRLGGHDPIKVYAAYKAAVEHKGSPTVILAKTIKGYGLGESGEGKNITHQQKKINDEELRMFRSRFGIPIPDEQLHDAPFYRPPEDSPEIQYMQERRKQLGGYLPERKVRAADQPRRSRGAVRGVLQGHGRPQGFDHDGVRAHAGETAARPGDRQADRAHHSRRSAHLRHGSAVPAGRHLLAAWASSTSRWTWTRCSITRKPKTGRFWRKGSPKPARCRRSSPPEPRTPTTASTRFRSSFSIRCSASSASAIWCGRRATCAPRLPGGRHRRAHDAGRRRLAASGRPQPPAGLSGAQPAGLRSGVRLRDGHHHPGRHPAHVRGGEAIFYYLTVMNEPLADAGHAGRRMREGILKGMYRYQASEKKDAKLHAQLFGSGTIMHEVLKAQKILEEKYDVAADVWSVTSYKQLYRDGNDCERWNMLHPGETPRVPFVTQCLKDAPGRCRGRIRLHEDAAGIDFAVAAAPAGGARHGRLRPQRRPGRAARLLRGGRQAHRAGHADTRWCATSRSSRM